MEKGNEIEILLMLIMYFVQPGCENNDDCYYHLTCVRDSDSDAYGTCKVSVNRIITRNKGAILKRDNTHTHTHSFIHSFIVENV